MYIYKRIFNFLIAKLPQIAYLRKDLRKPKTGKRHV